MVDEGAEGLAHCILAGERAGEQVRGRADLEHDLGLAQRGHQLRLASGEDPVADPVGAERLDHLAELGGCVLLALLADMDRDPEACRGWLETPFECPERIGQLALRQARVAGAHPRRHELVVQRWHEHLHAVVLDHRQPVQDVLLGRQRRHRLAFGRRAAHAIDELVDPSASEGCRGSAGKGLSPGELHARTRTRPRRIRLRYTRTFA